MAAIRGGVKDRIVHEIGRAIKQAQVEWCGVGFVRACTGRWLVLSLDAALLHGLHSLSRGYWPVVAALLDKQSLTTITNLPYATKPLSRGRSWVCLCLNEGQLESYLHVLTSHRVLLEANYGAQALLRDPHRAHLLLMLAAGLEHLKFSIPMDVPGWLQGEGSLGSSSGTSMNSLSVSITSMGSSLPSPSQQDPYDLDTSCSEAMEESWASRRKRGSRSSSQSSSRVSSGGTTPVESEVKTTNNAAEVGQLPQNAAICNQRISFESLGSIPFDSRTDVSQDGKRPITSCDNIDKCVNVSKVEKNLEDNIRFKEKLLKETSGERRVQNKEHVRRSVEADTNNCTQVTRQEENVCGENELVVVHRRNLPGSKNVEKRVSFTDTTDVEEHSKAIHNRLSLCGDLSKGTEIRDLGDLRDLLSNLRDQGLLPVSLALDELFISLDQSSPALSERAPPEGQEDPPLHQSNISLTPINNNNSVNDDSNNNNDSSDSSSTLVEDIQESTQGTDQNQEEEKQIGCFSQRSDIIGGVRWEELTMIGQKMLEEGSIEEKDITTQALMLQKNRGNTGDQEYLVTGTRPKQRQSVLKAESQMCQPENESERTRVLHKKKSSSRKNISQEERKRLYNESYREDRKLPSLYIPLKVDPSKYKEEEDRLALEVAQGQSNMIIPGHFAHPMTRQRISKQLFTSEDEKFYRLFNMREGHSGGSSVSVQVVLSSQALYVVTPLPRGAKPRHVVTYHDIHTIIVGSNDQWVCVLSKEAVRDDLATTGSSTGIQLEVGDPDITHTFVSCLEMAIRRHFSALKMGTKEKVIESGSVKKEFYPSARKGFLQEFTKECVDNFSNSLLEESLLNAWDTRKNSADISQGSELTQDSPVVTPGSGHLTQESTDASQESTDVSEVSNDISEASTEVSQTSADVSQVSAEVSQASAEVSQASAEVSQASADVSQASADVSQASADVSQASAEVSQASADVSQASSDVSQTSADVIQASADVSQVSYDVSQGSSDISRVSTDASQESTDTSQPTSISHSSSVETPTSSDMIQSLSNMSQESLDDGHEPVDGDQEPCNKSQGSGDTSQGSKTADYACPVKLYLQKEDIYHRYAGGYSRWNGTLLDRSLPGVVVHPAWELAGLRKWLRAQLRLKNSPEVIGYWLADWEDGSSLGGGDAISGPLGPSSEGPLMFKPPGILNSWRPAYFILKAGVLYQFNDSRERLPHMIVEVVRCVGCVRISSNQRPHAFQLLRKKEAPLMLAASDEQQASLWLQAFLTIINSGVRDISERKQVPCRVVLLESGVLLAQQSDLFLGSPPEVIPLSNQDKSLSTIQHSQQLLETSPATLSIQSQVQCEKKGPQKPVNFALANLKDRKPLSSSLTALNHTGSSSSLLASPRKRISTGERTSTPIHNTHQHQGNLSRLSDCGIPDIKPDVPNSDEKNTSGPQKKITPQKIQKREPTRGAQSQLYEGFKPKGEVKVLTFSTMEHLSSVSVYAECPNTCLMEFECSEAGEISGDWALYFRSGNQLQEFITSLACTWKSLTQLEFPLHTVENAAVQQFLLEGSQISSNGWSCLHL
ncbi:uncharacterized protein LOC121878195 isoform X2 [Homarus americanus]|uniref:uncharacterized protein LOC121878195 isoform X2 n=1 Tax=Homarus americanus TaxID=6706 RepID=UPI001C43F876|nr:uncharacterized protein LOC121878195 isoform X2 [Homarus americanus]